MVIYDPIRSKNTNILSLHRDFIPLHSTLYATYLIPP
jgi:hypothetical protein